MNQALELLQTEPAEKLQRNLNYITRNMRRDFVADALAEALIPEGRSLAGTVKFLYEKQENYDLKRIMEIAGFINGFEGLEKITEGELSQFDFTAVKESRERVKKAFKAIPRKALIHIAFGLSAGFTASSVTANYMANYYGNIENMGLALTTGVIAYLVSAIGLGYILLDGLGDTKPAEIFTSLCHKASQADNYLRLYTFLEEKRFEMIQ